MRTNAPRQPVMTLKRRRLTVTVVGAVVALVTGVWALWPVPRMNRDSLSFVPPPENPTNDRRDADPPRPHLDAEVFRTARLWNPPPEPARSEDNDRQEIVVKRPELELIGIIEEEGVYSAALYDRNRNEMRIVASGDRIEPYRVAAITSEEVRLEDGRHIARLVVRNEEARSP